MTDVPRYAVYLPLGENERAMGVEAAIESCGGLMALRALSEALGRVDGPSVLVSCPRSDLPLETRRALRDGRTVAVYPEAVAGNPLRASRRVRWVLWHVGRSSLRRWERTGDRIRFYWPQFHPDGTGFPLLTLIDVDQDRFRDRGLERAGVCYRVGKGFGTWGEDAAPTPAEVRAAAAILEGSGSPVRLVAADIEAAPTALPDRLALDELSRAFNRHKVFVSYDPESATSVLAALCGCISVIIPPRGVPRSRALPCFEHGVAWGWDDLPRAVRSLPKVVPYVRRLLADQDASVRAFAMDLWPDSREQCP